VRVLFKLGLQGSELEQLSFESKSVSLDLGSLGLLLSQLLREKLLLGLKNLKVLVSSKELLIVVSRFLLSLQGLILGLLNEFLKFFFRAHQ
jgi:hypothetical protein